MPQIAFSPLPLTSLPDDLRPVLAYWTGLTDSRPAPTWREFDMMQIPCRLLPFTMVKDVETGPHGMQYRYRFYGTGLVEVNQVDLTGKTTDDVVNADFADSIRASLDEFSSRFAPQFYRVTSTARYSRDLVQSLLRLPLSDDRLRVTHVVSIISDHVGKDRYRELLGDAEPLDSPGTRPRRTAVSFLQVCD